MTTTTYSATSEAGSVDTAGRCRICMNRLGEGGVCTTCQPAGASPVRLPVRRRKSPATTGSKSGPVRVVSVAEKAGGTGRARTRFELPWRLIAEVSLGINLLLGVALYLLL